MPQKLKLEGDASQRFQTTLGDQSVFIELAWHDISESWFLGIELADGTPVTKGRRLSTNTFALEGILTPNFAGDLVALSLVTPSTELTRDSWTTTHTLTYYAEGESVEFSE